MSEVKPISPPSLSTLPIEVLILVGQHLDKTSLIELSRVSRSLTSLASDSRLWQHLSLSLPRYYGVHPSFRELRPSTEDGIEGGDPSSWMQAVEEADDIWKRQEDALRDLLKEIILRADAKRWSLVEEVTLSARAGAVHHMLVLLDYVSPTVRRLEIEVPTFHPYHLIDFQDIFERCNLDIVSDSFRPSFTALSHLCLGLSGSNGKFLRLLIISSPNLSTLEVDIDHTIPVDDDEQDDSDVASYESHPPTRICRLRFSWNKRGVEAEVCPGPAMLLGVVQHCPEIQEVNLEYDPNFIGPLWESIAGALLDLPHLRDLRWPEPVLDSESGFTSLRRLAITGDRWEDISESHQPMPLLQILYLDTMTPGHRLSPRKTDWPDAYPTEQTMAKVATGLRHYPLLHSIHVIPTSVDVNDMELFDKLDGLSHEAPEYIWSMRHGGEEMIQVSFRREYKQEYAGLLHAEASELDAAEYKIMHYTLESNDGSEERMANVFLPLVEPVSVTMADYEGRMVPPEIVREMREVEGDRVQNWEKRGVEVGDEAWAVLEKWYERAVYAEPACGMSGAGWRGENLVE